MDNNSSRSVSDLVKGLGNVLLQTNSEILELAELYSKTEQGISYDDKEKNIKSKVKSLQDALKSLEVHKEYVSDRFISALKNTVTSAKSLLDRNCKLEDEVSKAKNRKDEIKASVDEVMEKGKKTEEELKVLSKNLAGCMKSKDDVFVEQSLEEQIDIEIQFLEPYVRDRYYK